MITLMVFGALGFVSCLAAAGLIASTQNQTFEARSMADLEVGPDVHA
jgi:short subunit dehydrogenase-like uncharacterized protein